MDFRFSLACSHMMMECPRCGFAQPKDQYCAKCGLDVDHYTAKPKPILVRLAQNSNVHLSLIAGMIVLIVGYIIFSQSKIVRKQVNRLFSTPITSRDAGEPRSAADLPPPPPPPSATQAQDAVEPVSETTAGVAPEPAAPTEAEPAAAKKDVSKVEVTTWEIPRDALTSVLTGAEKIEQSNGGRAYLIKDGAKTVEALSSGGHRVGGARTLPIDNGAQLAIETPPTTPESFQFGLYFQVSKVDGKDLGLKWESTMVLPAAEAATTTAAADPNAAAFAGRAPSVKALTEVSLNGSAAATAQSAVLIVFEPTTRAIRDDSLAKAGEGPWAIFGSYEFRSGATEWVTLVQLK